MHDSECRVETFATGSWPRWYLLSGKKKIATKSWTIDIAAASPYHHEGEMASAMGLAHSVHVALITTWTVC